MILKRIAALVTVTLLATALLLAGCSATTAPTQAPTTAATVAPTDTPTAAPTDTATVAPTDTAAATTAPASVSGSITVVGSTALQPLAQKAADMFTAANSGASIQVQGGGSGTGLTQVSQKACDIGDSDLFAADKLTADQAQPLVDHQVCVVGFAAVVSPDVTVTNLTQQQLIDIFTAKISNWKDVGGKDEKIVIINRAASSGTRFTFKKYALNGNDEATGTAVTGDSSGDVRKMVASTPGSISYLAFSYLDSTVKPLQFNGVDPTAANVESGTYPIWSYEHMYTNGEATGLAKAFIDYITSDAFKPQITALSYIPASDMKVSR